MFTSRAEFRLHLRPDNADQRLTEKAIQIGCASKERTQVFRDTTSKMKTFIMRLKSDERPVKTWKKVLDKEIPCSQKTLHSTKSAFDLLSVNTYNIAVSDFPGLDYLNPIFAEKVKTEALYERVVESQRDEMNEIQRDESCEIPYDLDYSNPSLNLSHEEMEKLSASKPGTIAAASRISGITPNAILGLLRFVKRKNRTENSENFSPDFAQ